MSELDIESEVMSPTAGDSLDPHEIRDSETFRSPDADIIIISSHRVAFKVHSRMLIEASTVFQTMFSLPQPQISSDNTTPPEVHMDDNSEILHLLLKYIYPSQKPDLSLKQIRALLWTADKYDLEWMKSALRHVLVSENFLRESPVQVFLIAQSHDLQEEARVACRRSLADVDVVTLQLEPGDLLGQSGLEMCRLMQLHQSRARSAYGILQAFTLQTCYGCDDARGRPRWWFLYFLPLFQHPTSKDLFTLKVVTDCLVSSGCPTCWGTLGTWTNTLETLTAQIDVLPDTIE
jgi:hypothetical protein